MTVAHERAPGAPIDKITAQFKGDQPTVTIYLGKPGGGEDRLMAFDARTEGVLVGPFSIVSPTNLPTASIV